MRLRSWKTKCLSVIYIIALLIIATIDGSACDCIGRRGLAESDAVFTGTVIGIRNLTDSLGVYEIEFRVVKWIKTAETKTAKVKVYQRNHIGGCGFPFAMDAVYEVVAYAAAPGHLMTDGCSDTRKITDIWWWYETEHGLDSAAAPGTGTAALKGRVTGPRGRPLKDARVVLHIMKGNRQTERTAIPGESGNYIFPGLDSGDYHLLVFAPDHDSQHISGIQATDQPIELNVVLTRSRRKGSRTINRIYDAEKDAGVRRR